MQANELHKDLDVGTFQTKLNIAAPVMDLRSSKPRRASSLESKLGHMGKDKDLEK